MPITKKEVSSPPVEVAARAPAPISGTAISKDQSIARSVAINNTFGAGWFKDHAQTVSLDDALKKGFEVAGQIEAWLTR